ncbi:hypothetical protein GW17_00029544 [Ensete ventricosum]|nr:hypothetical protein GW17_00029544 [Ensete ventricosum]
MQCFIDEIHGLTIGRNIVKNLYMAGRGENSPPSNSYSYEDPLYDEKELTSIAPVDQKQPFDIRSIIARIVDGSEFDEFKKYYGTVRALRVLEDSSAFCVSLMNAANARMLLVSSPKLRGATRSDKELRLITLCFDQMQWSKEEEDKFKSRVVESYGREASPYFSTARLWDDGIIHPSDTRKVIGLCLSASIKPHPEDTKYGVFRM